MSTFWKPGQAFPHHGEMVIDREIQAEGGELYQGGSFDESSSNLTLEQQRKRLPIYKDKLMILYAIEKYRVTILVGETGLFLYYSPGMLHCL